MVREIQLGLGSSLSVTWKLHQCCIDASATKNLLSRHCAGNLQSTHLFWVFNNSIWTTTTIVYNLLVEGVVVVFVKLAPVLHPRQSGDLQCQCNYNCTSYDKLEERWGRLIITNLSIINKTTRDRIFPRLVPRNQYCLKFLSHLRTERVDRTNENNQFTLLSASD